MAKTIGKAGGFGLGKVIIDRMNPSIERLSLTEVRKMIQTEKLETNAESQSVKKSENFSSDPMLLSSEITLSALNHKTSGFVKNARRLLSNKKINQGITK